MLSAVDQHVGRQLIDKVLGPKGLLATKTRILATNSIPVLIEADYITLLRNGKILEKGTYSQLQAMKGEVSNLIKTASNEEQGAESRSPSLETSKDSSSSRSGGSGTIVATGTGNSGEEEEEKIDAPDGLAPLRVDASTGRRTSTLSTTTLRRASTVSLKAPHGKLTDEEGAPTHSKQSKEFSEQGKVKWDVYLEYAKTSNIVAVTIYLITLIAAQTAQVGGSLWLKHWSWVNEEYGGNPDVGFYIGIYLAFGIGGAAVVVVQTLILWIFCSIEVRLGSKPLRWTERDIDLPPRHHENFTREWHTPFFDRQ